jgi:hypothetical protein
MSRSIARACCLAVIATYLSFGSALMMFLEKLPTSRALHAFCCRFQGSISRRRGSFMGLEMSYLSQSDVPILGSTHNLGANHIRMHVSG